MKATEGDVLITPDDLHWRPSNLMKIPNADYLERTGSEISERGFGVFHPGARTRCTSTYSRRSFILFWKGSAACA